MAVSVERVVVGTSATALNASVTAGLQMTLRNGAAAVDLGAADVTSGDGYELAADEVIQIDLDPGDVLYAISATSSSVQVLRT